MKTAFILAAGRGERLRPLTDQIPKALVPLKGKPLIEHHLEKLVQAGFERIIINHAHLGGLIKAFIQSKNFGVPIYFSAEPPGALETGGGLVNALPLIGEEPFLVVNADIYTDYPFQKPKLPEGSLAHLVLISKPESFSRGDFNLTPKGVLENAPGRYTFTGIACYHPKAFQNQPIGRYSVTPLLRQLADAHQASGEIYPGVWVDTGTLTELNRAQLS